MKQKQILNVPNLVSANPVKRRIKNMTQSQHEVRRTVGLRFSEISKARQSQPYLAFVAKETLGNHKHAFLSELKASPVLLSIAQRTYRNPTYTGHSNTIY